MNTADLVDSLTRAVREHNLALERGDHTTADLLALAINEIRVALGGISLLPDNRDDVDLRQPHGVGWAAS